jgi:hypothetical protein
MKKIGSARTRRQNQRRTHADSGRGRQNEQKILWHRKSKRSKKIERRTGDSSREENQRRANLDPAVAPAAMHGELDLPQPENERGKWPA